MVIRRPTETLVENRYRVVSGLSEQRRQLSREILVQLETHADHRASGSTRSFANSAA